MRIKGIAIKNTIAAVETVHGAEGLARVREAMPPRIREATTRILPLEWYPVEITAALHAGIRDALGGGKWEESHRISVEAGRMELNGVYRMLLRAVQYDTVWDRMERMWPQYYDRGEARWVDRGRGHATARFTGVSGFNLGMWNSVAGRIDTLLQMTGSRGAATTIKESATTYCTIEALWLE